MRGRIRGKRGISEKIMSSQKRKKKEEEGREGRKETYPSKGECPNTEINYPTPDKL